MKIAYFGYNAFSSCLQLLISSGHEIVCIYTGENSLFSDRVISLAKQHQIPLSFDKPDKSQMDKLLQAGVELFLAAEYPWKIPVPDELEYAINIHPSMLPEGRGPTPLPWLLLSYPEHAGITLHKMTNHFDQGEILLQKTIPIDENESFDTLSAKLYIEMPLLLNKLLDNLKHYYLAATKQKTGSNWKKLTHAEQTINWHQSTSLVLKHIRAFGSLGVYTQLTGENYLINAADGVECQHSINPGEVVLVDDMHLIVATNNGLISITKNGFISVN